jgi:hypothetical protein
LIDTREWAGHQDDPGYIPLDLSPLAWERATLKTGDYSVKGLENIISIERKAQGDMLSCMGSSRERFEAELVRMLAYPCRCLVIESTWKTFESGDYRSDVKPASAIGSLLSWQMMGIPILMAGDHARTGRYVARMLLLAARRRWRENRGLLAVLDKVPEGGKVPF